MTEEWRKASATLFLEGKKEEPGNYRPISLTSIPWKVMEQLILATIPRHGKDKKIIVSVDLPRGSQA